MKLSEKINSLKALEDEIKALKEKKRTTFERITGVPSKQILVMDDNWISFDCKNISELQVVLKGIKPGKTGWKIGHKNCEYFTGHYRVDIENGVNRRKLKIQLETLTGLKVWASINMADIPNGIVDKYFLLTSRNLYDTEHHYFIGMSYKQLREIKVPCYSVYSNGLQVSWYGGNKTISDADTAHELIDDILNFDL